MKKKLLKINLCFVILMFISLAAHAQFSTPTIDATYDGAGNYPNSYNSGGTNWYLTWDNTDLSVCITNANQGEPVSIFLDVDPIVPVNGGSNTDGNLQGIAYDGYTGPPNLPFRADILIYAHNGYRELFRRDGAGAWASLGGGNDGICGGGLNDYTGNANGKYASNDNGNGNGGDDRREFKISWARLQGAINGGARPSAFNWFGYISYSNGMYAQVPVENYNGNNVNGNNNGLVRYFTVSNTGNGTSTNPFGQNSYTNPITTSNPAFGGISVYDFTMNSPDKVIMRTAGGGNAWTIAGNLVVANGTISSGSSATAITTNNLDIRDTLILSSAVGGDLNIAGNFVKTSGTFTCSGRQVNFNGNVAQSYSNNASEAINYLLISNTTANVTATAGPALLVPNNLTINAGANCRLDMGARSLNLTGSTGNIINGNLRIGGTSGFTAITGSTSATTTFSSTGTYEHNYSSVVGGAVPSATWIAGSNCSIIGYTSALGTITGLGQAFSNFNWNCPLQAALGIINMAGALTTINGNFNFINSNLGKVRLTDAVNVTTNIGGNLTVSGGTFGLATSNGNVTLNISGNLVVNGGTFENPIGANLSNLDVIVAGDFIQTAGTYTFGPGGAASTSNLILRGAFNQTGGVITNASGSIGTIDFAGTVNQNVSINSATNILSWRCNNSAGITLLTDLPINMIGKFRLTKGAISGIGNIVYASTTRLIYDGTTTITSSDKEWPSTTGFTVEVNNPAGVNLHANRTFPNSQLTITSGILYLGNFDITIPFNNSGSIAVPIANASNMLVTNGTGQLKYVIPTLAYPATPFTYQFYIGDATGTKEYSPLYLRVSKNTVARTIGVRVVDGISPNMNTPSVPSNYLSRYWIITESPGTGTYRDSIRVYYPAADIVGNETLFKLSTFAAGDWTEQSTSLIPSTYIETNIAYTESSLPLNGLEITGRQTPPTIVSWVGGTSNDWNTPANWSTGLVPTSVSDVTIGVSSPNPCTINSASYIINSLNLNGTGVLNMASGTSLTVSGGFNYVNTASAVFNCNSTLNLSTSSSLNVPALNYGNLNLAGGDRILANSGNIGICGTFTPGGGAYTIAGSTVNFNGSGAQTIPVFSFEGLTISGARTTNSVTLANGGTIDCSGVFNPTATFTSGNYITTGNTFNYNGLAGQVIKAFNYNNLSCTNINRTLQNAGVIGIAATFTVGTGVYTTTGSTVAFNGSWAQTIPLITTSVAGTSYNNLNIEGGSFTPTRDLAGATTISGNLTLNGGDFRQSTSAGVAFTVVGNLNLTNANARFTQHTGNVSTNITNVNGNWNQTAGTFDFNNSVSGTGDGLVNLNGNFSATAGNITSTTTGTPTVNSTFTFNGSGVQTYSRIAGTNSFTDFVIGANKSLQLLSNIAVTDGDITVGTGATLNAQGFTVFTSNSGGSVDAFSTNTTSLIRTSNAGGIVSLIAGGTFTNSTTAYWQFDGANQNTGFNTTPAISAAGRIIVNVSGTLTNTSSGALINVSDRVMLMQGIFYLNNCDLYIGSAANFTGSNAFSASNMIVNGTATRYAGSGRLLKNFTSGALVTSFTFPIGDNTGTAEYSPVTVDLNITTSASPYIAIKCRDAKHPLDPSITNYLTRYWESVAAGVTSGTVTAVCTYLPIDIVGSDATIKMNRFAAGTGLWTQDLASTAGSNLLTSIPLTQANYTDHDLCGRAEVPLYFRSVATGPYEFPTTWQVADNIAFTGAITPSTVPIYSNSDLIQIRNTHNVTANTTNIAVDQTVIDFGGTLTIAAAGAPMFVINNGIGNDLTVDGTLAKFSTASVLTVGNIQVNATGIFEHNCNGGLVPTATWIAGSICKFNGITTTAPVGGLNQAFSNVLWSSAGQSAAIHLNGSLNNIGNDFTVSSTGAGPSDLRLFSNNANAGGNVCNIGGNLNVGGGVLSLMDAGVSGLQNCTVTVNGNISVSAGKLDMTGSDATFNSTGAINLYAKGDVTFSGSGVLAKTTASGAGGTTNFEFRKTSGIQNWNCTVGGVSGAAISNFRIGDGTTTNTLLLGSNFAFNAAPTFTVLASGTLDCLTNTVSGGVFTLNAAGILKMGSSVGITAAPTAAGNIQTTTRNFGTGANYIYNGLVNQSTGVGLPVTVNALGIDNGSGNTVVLTNAGTTTVTTALNLASGLFNIGGANIVSMGTGSAVSASLGNLTSGVAGGTILFVGSGTVSGPVNFNICNIRGGVNFGTGAIIDNLLEIQTGGFTNINAASYSVGSILRYNTGGTYGRNTEWSSVSGAGHPYHVEISNTYAGATILNMGGGSPSVARTCSGNLTVLNTNTFTMNTIGSLMTAAVTIGGDAIINGNMILSSLVGGDLNVKGNWNRIGTFTPNSRQVNFNGTSGQTITGATTFDYLKMSNSSTGITLNNAIVVNNNLDFNSGIITIGTNNLTISAGGTITNAAASKHIVTNSTGFLIQRVVNANTLFPVGISSGYAPATFNQNATAENLSVRVSNTITNPVNDATKIVNLEWIVNESVAGANNYSSIFQWNGTDEAGAFSRLVPVFQGNWGGADYLLRGSTISGGDPYASTSTNNYTGNLSNMNFVMGNLTGLHGDYCTAVDGDWNTPSTWNCNCIPPVDAAICINHNLTVNVANTNDVSVLSVNAGVGRSLTIANSLTVSMSDNGIFTNNSSVSGIGLGIVNFTGNGTVNGTISTTFENITVNGGVTFSTIPTINNNLRINSGGFVTGTPIYGPASVLVYNTGGTYGVSDEWTGNSATVGSGVPFSLTLLNATTLNMPATSRGIAGHVSISDGLLSMGTGDIYVAGNWARNGATGTFNPNGKAVFLNGSTTQLVTITGGGTEVFNYLVIDKPAGDVLLNNAPATNIEINGAAGNTLQFINAGGVNLNGQALNLTNAGGGILVSGGPCNILGLAGSLVAVQADKYVTSSLGGTLNFANTVKVALSAGMNFGSSISTINGTLQLVAGGYVNTNPPTYGAASLLRYFTGNNYGRGLEWSATSGPGYPNNVEVEQNGTPTTVDLSNGGSALRQIAGNLTINNGGNLTMNAMVDPLVVLGDVIIGGAASGTLTLSSVLNGDIRIAKDLTKNAGGTFNQNGREVTMNGTTIQSISSNINNFGYLNIDNTSASVLINANTVVNNRLHLSNGLLDLNGFNLTIGNGGMVRRSVATATMSSSPIVNVSESYDVQYDATMNNGVEFNTCLDCVRDLVITSGTLTITANKTVNRDIKLAGDFNLGAATLTYRGRSALNAGAGNLDITSGARTITGSAGAIFDIVGLGSNTPAEYTKVVTNSGAGSLNFDANILVRIGDGRMNWGTGNPVTVSGTLQVAAGGSVISNACYYAVGSIVRFANNIDYQVNTTDLVWASGAINSGLPGIPWNVHVIDNGTDLNINDLRALRNDLEIYGGSSSFTLNPALVGSFNIGGNWTRTGASTVFNHNNKKVVFDKQIVGNQIITANGGLVNETFYDVDFQPNSGNINLTGNVNVLNALHLISGKVDLNGSELILGSIASNGTLTGGNSTSYFISGTSTAKLTRYTTTNNTTYFYPMGDAINYTPISVQFFAGAMNTNSRISANIIASPHPNLGTSTNYLSRYWQVEPTNIAIGTPYGVSYTYVDADIIGVEANLKPYKHNTGGWIAATGSGALYEMGTGSVVPASNTINWTGLSTFSDFTGNGNGTPLPISLLNFDANPLLDEVVVKWSTASQTNNDYFTIEKSKNAVDFKPLEIIDGAGNSNTILNYHIVDATPYDGVSYYRLKQTDYDGQYTYSEIKAVRFSASSSSVAFAVFPNPTSANGVNIQTGKIEGGKLSVKLYDILGKVVYSNQINVNPDGDIQRINLSGASIGIYFVELFDGSNTKTIKLVIDKE